MLSTCRRGARATVRVVDVAKGCFGNYPRRKTAAVVHSRRYASEPSKGIGRWLLNRIYGTVVVVGVTAGGLLLVSAA